MIDVLGETELGARLRPAHLERLSILCRGVSFEKDATIFEEGGEATDLFVLRSGNVHLEMRMRFSADGPVMPTVLESISSGGIFGWSALVEPFAYTLSARAVTNCTALAIRGDLLSKAMGDDPALGYALMASLTRVVAGRLADTRKRLTNGVGMILHSQEIESAV